MTVFLRWGAFALLSIAALIYAYRVNERSDDIRARLTQQLAVRRAANAERERRTAPVDQRTAATPLDPLSPACEEELQVAIGAARSATAGEPLDRVLRQERIAWQGDPPRKARLTAAAQLGYSLAEKSVADIRRAIAAGCPR
ncbi:MAG: hypothetical protein KDI32_03065 [Pseudomonadales bacterium]|nr:hypothetical protein [Pseudomonadales bacterium]